MFQDVLNPALIKFVDEIKEQKLQTKRLNSLFYSIFVHIGATYRRAFELLKTLI